jgi:SAM-dependent methyltransferase
VKARAKGLLQRLPFFRSTGDAGESVTQRNFQQDFDTFKSLSAPGESRFTLRWEDRYPCLDDKTTTTGFDRHYIYHCAWAARVLASAHPALHTDISSSLYFCSIASAFFPIRFYDYRAVGLRLSNLSTGVSDLLGLPFGNDSIPSLSCMHVVEHIGLGRYGDPLDPDGDLKAIAELKRVLAPGGSLLFVVPVGRPRIMFNAHRIYSYRQIVEYFSELELKQFALIPDDPQDGDLVYDATEEMANAQTYGCGCFWLKKKTL